MSKETTNQILGIKYTVLFGTVEENSKYYDIRDEVGKKIIDYRLIKIKCQLKSNDSIKGIQFIYRNIITSQEVALINVKSKELNLIEQEMDFKMEEIVDLRVWIKDEQIFKLIGFEITTSKGRNKKFGYGDDEQLRKCPDFMNKDRAIIGFGVAADDENGVTALYAYYLNKRTYALHLYSGVISLRIKIKDEEFRKKIKAKLPSMSEKNNILFRVCDLPDNQFFNIIKYAVS